MDIPYRKHRSPDSAEAGYPAMDIPCRSRSYRRLQQSNPQFAENNRRLFLKNRSRRSVLQSGGGGEAPPPKGHVVMYVGGGDKGAGPPPKRYVVPVVYFNHPLFRELLMEAEEEFGFRNPGGITIPCSVCRFEIVQKCIDANATFRWKSDRRRLGLRLARWWQS